MFLALNGLTSLTVPLCFVNAKFYFVAQNCNGRTGTTLFAIEASKVESSLSTGTARSAAKRCAEFPQFEIGLFHNPVLTSNGSMLYTIGKVWRKSDAVHPGQAGGSGETGKFVLKILRMDMRTFAAKEFHIDGEVPFSTETPPALFVDPSSECLFVLSEMRTRQTRGGQEIEMAEWDEELGRMNYVSISCLYKVELFDETSGTFQLAELVLPLPSLKPTQHMRMPFHLPEVIHTKFVPDDLRFHPLRINTGNMDICIFALNSDATAHLFDGRSWRRIQPSDEFSKKYAESLRETGIRTEHSLFSTAGRIFLHDRQFKRTYSYAEGPLYEILVDEHKDSFRFVLHCPRILIPTWRIVAAADLTDNFRSRCLTAFSRSYGWKSSSDGLHLKPLMQISLKGPPSLTAICFWNLQDQQLANQSKQDDDDDDLSDCFTWHSGLRLAVQPTQIQELRRAMRMNSLDAQATTLYSPKIHPEEFFSHHHSSVHHT